jgi:hypothetical protein
MFRRRREFEFPQLQRKLILLLRFFPGGDGFTQRTRMFPVERFRQRRFEGRLFRITYDHAGPRDRLQHQPLRVGCREQRDDQEEITDPFQHIRNLTSICAAASKKWPNHLRSAWNSTAGNPNQRAAGQQIEQWNQIRVGQVNAAAGSRSADARLVSRAVEVNVPGV